MSRKLKKHQKKVKIKIPKIQYAKGGRKFVKGASDPIHVPTCATVRQQATASSGGACPQRATARPVTGSSLCCEARSSSD